MSEKKRRWTSIPCPKCSAKNSMREISYAYLPNARERDAKCSIRMSERVGGNEPEIACIECNWRGSKNKLRELWYEFRGSDPLVNAPWGFEELGLGMRARFQRTLTNSFNFDWGGTAGYRYGVDFHTQIHCEICCCTPTVEFGCKSPAAGFFIVGSKVMRDWAVSNATFHLSDKKRHN